MKKLQFIIIIFLITTQLTYGQTTKNFNLKQAQEYALDNNKTLQNTRDDIRIAKAKISETKAANLPKLEGSMEYMTYFNYEFALDFGGSASPPNINYALLDAGDYEIIKLLDAMSGSSEGNTIVMSDQANANLQLSQLIFSGQYWVGLKMAKIAKELQEKNLILTELETKQQVINSYYLILITENFLNIIDSNETNLHKIFKHTQNMYNAGFAEKTDVDQIQMNLMMLKHSKTEMQRNDKLNKNLFRLLLGLENNTQFELTESIDDFLKKIEMLENINFDVESNPTYKLIEEQENLTKKNLKMQKWSYAPTIVGYYSYTEKIMTSGFDLTPKHAAGLSLSIPIIAGGEKRAQISQAKIELDKANRSKNLLKEQLEMQNNQLNYDYKNAYENYLLQKQSVAVSKRVYNSYQNKYKQGLLSSLELTQANTTYLEAESNYLSAIMELLTAKLALDKLYNKL